MKTHHVIQKVRFTHPDDGLTHTGIVVACDSHSDGTYDLEVAYREETHVTDTDGNLESIEIHSDNVQTGWVG